MRSKSQRKKAQRQKKERDKRALTVLPHDEPEQVRKPPRGGFYPELILGVDALTPARCSEIKRFLVAVVQKRGHPLHLANLWNALYFGYDIRYGGFHVDQIEQKRIPLRKAESRAPALPVGGFIRVHTNMQCGDLLAEVIYKEGAHPDISDDDGWIEPAVSGAPGLGDDVTGGGRETCLRERFVLDLFAFGQSANAINAQQYSRLCKKALWLDPHGHLIMDAMYESASGALEDLDYYLDYLLREHREGLLAFCFTDDDVPDELLRGALLRSFETVRELALGSSELRDWRGKYFFSKADYERQLGDVDGVLGSGDLMSILSGLRQLPPRNTCGYSTIRSRVVELLQRDGLSPEDHAWTSGPHYASAICYSNRYIADCLTSADKGEGDAHLHLRLDDDWQGGGVWRAERIAEGSVSAFVSLDPTIPLGLGYAGTQSMTEEEPIESDEMSLASSQKAFRVPLTQRDRILGRLRLPTDVANMLADGPVDVVVRGDGGAERTPVRREGSWLFGVSYPLSFHPGTILLGNVERQGSVVRIRRERAATPLKASDGMVFDYETNLAVYERALGLKEGLDPQQKRGAPSLVALISRAFRVAGRRLGESGELALTLSDITTLVLGPEWKAGDTRPIALALAAMGLERDGASYIWKPRITNRISAGDGALLRAFGETSEGEALVRTVRRHWVPMFLRHYSEEGGRSPSARNMATYAEARRRFQMQGVLPEELPPGCSWVSPHRRGKKVPLPEDLPAAVAAAEGDTVSPALPTVG